jgi:hypothetical protein
VRAGTILEEMLHAILAATLVLLAGCAPRVLAPAGESFSFALIGDVPYSAGAEERFERMLQAINDDRSIRFVLHAGDLKGSGEPCSDELLRRRLAQLQFVWTALVYTPGDNDWTDCHRAGAGGHRPLERLDALRRHAYPEPGRSLGQAPLALQSQTGFPENAQFMHGRVAFVTLHVTGSNNGLEPWRAPPADNAVRREEQLVAFGQREAANLAWLAAAFARARADDAIGVVVLMHANPRFELPPGDGRRAGFEAIIDALRRLTAEFDRPVLLLQGDGHLFLVDRPLAGASPPLPNLRRVQAFGHPWMEWIRIDVDPGSAAVFGIGVGTQHGVITG